MIGENSPEVSVHEKICYLIFESPHVPIVVTMVEFLVTDLS